MNKVLRIIFLASIVFNIVYLIQDDEIMITNLKDKIFKLKDENLKLKSELKRLKKFDEVSTQLSSIKKKQINNQDDIDSATQKTFKEHAPKRDEENLDDSQLKFEEKAYQEESEKFFKQAHNRISEFLEVKIGLNPEQIELYESLKEGRSKEIDEFIKNRMEELKKDGETTMFLSMEDTIEIGKINQSYLKRFKSSIGSEAYERYRKFKREFNQEMANDPNNMFPFIVEF
jgi:hypothetical protein